MRLLVAVDGSANSASAFEMALKIARPEHDELLLLTVTERLPPLTGRIPRSYLESAQAQLRKRSTKVLEHFAQIAKEHGVRWRPPPSIARYRCVVPDSCCRYLSLSLSQQFKYTAVEKLGSSVGPVVCAVATKRKADTIIIGRRGLSPLGEFFMGSTSSYCTANAPCSILVVRDRGGHHPVPAVQEEEPDDYEHRHPDEGPTDFV